MLGWELECVLKGWEAIERFQQGGSMTDSQCLRIILDCGGIRTHTFTHTHTRECR